MPLVRQATACGAFYMMGATSASAATTMPPTKQKTSSKRSVSPAHETQGPTNSKTTKKILLEISEELHAAITVQAAIAGKPMSRWAEEQLERVSKENMQNSRKALDDVFSAVSG
jgi:hypothetical protein